MDYATIFKSFRSRDSFEPSFSTLLRTIEADNPHEISNLRLARSCLSIGPGWGRNEIEIVERLLPGLKSFTAVESDEASASMLKQALQRHMLDVASVVHQERIEEWEPNMGEQFDIILLINILYYLGDDERQAIYRKLFQDGNWLAPGGQVFIVGATRGSTTLEPFDGLAIIDRMNPKRTYLSHDDFKDEMLKVGFEIQKEYSFVVSMDFSKPDNQLRQFFERWTGNSLSLCDLEKIILQEWPNERNNILYKMFILSKPQLL